MERTCSAIPREIHRPDDDDHTSLNFHGDFEFVRIMEVQLYLMSLRYLGQRKVFLLNPVSIPIPRMAGTSWEQFGWPIALERAIIRTSYKNFLQEKVILNPPFPFAMPR